MTFHSAFFLLVFLPVCLSIYYLAPRPYKNAVALAGSLVFYSWGQIGYLPLLLALILANYFLARQVELQRDRSEGPKTGLILGIVINLLPLLVIKILSAYGAGRLDSFLPGQLPLGISYVVFQLISYQVDIHNELVEREKNLLNFSLYVLLFPKIVVGPITRFRDLAAQMNDRQINLEGFTRGARSFILGLAKKVLIADILAQTVNPAFGLSTPAFGTGTAWFVLVAFSLQLYFDFSGYTDMAIGLAQMLGFRLPENFNYPYISKSISEFWRRWHITLSNWFRDYIFYPLEYTRRRAERWRQILHVIIVFLLTGLWHGLLLNYVIWGLIHGLAIAVEMSGFGKSLKKLWTPLQHTYTLAILLLGWVFFRSANLEFAFGFLGRLVGWQTGADSLLPVLDPITWAAFGLGIVLSLPVLPALQKMWQPVQERSSLASASSRIGVNVFLILVLIGSAVWMTSHPGVASIYGSF